MLWTTCRLRTRVVSFRYDIQCDKVVSQSGMQIELIWRCIAFTSIGYSNSYNSRWARVSCVNVVSRQVLWSPRDKLPAEWCDKWPPRGAGVAGVCPRTIHAGKIEWARGEI